MKSAPVAWSSGILSKMKNSSMNALTRSKRVVTRTGLPATDRTWPVLSKRKDFSLPNRLLCLKSRSEKLISIAPFNDDQMNNTQQINGCDRYVFD